MSYLDFVFDLQRFADEPVEITVDLTKVKDVLTTGTKYLVESDGNAEWKDATASVADGETLVATLSGGVLEIVKTNTKDTVTLTGTDITEEELLASGLTIQAKTASETAASSTEYTLKEKTAGAEKVVGTITGTVLVMDAAAREVVDTDGAGTASYDATAKTKSITLTAITADAEIKCYAGFSSDKQCQSWEITVNKNNEGIADGTATLTASGDEAGVYTGVKLAGAVIIHSTSDTSAGPTVKDNGGDNGAVRTVAPAAFAAEGGSLTLPSADFAANTQTATKLFAVTVDGGLKVVAATAENNPADAIGYLKVTYDKDYGRVPTATITFVSDFEGNDPSTLLTGGPLTINAENIATIGGVATAKIIVDDSVKSLADKGGSLNITKVPTSADVYIYGTKYEGNLTGTETTGNDGKNVITYVSTDVLSSTANTINLSGLGSLSADATYYFGFTVDDKVNDHGKIVYKIAAGTTDGTGFTGDNAAAHFELAYTSNTYTLSFVGGEGEGTTVALTDTSWKNIQINAANLPAGKTLEIKSVGAASTDTTNDSYTVNNAVNGLTVTLTRDTASGNVDNSTKTVNRTAKSTATTYVYKDADGNVINGNSITLPTGDTTENWEVSGPVYDGELTGDGNPVITITKQSGNNTGSTGSYISISKKSDSGSSVYDVSYTNGAGISLTSGATTGTPAKVEINAEGLTAGATINLKDTDSDKVDFGLRNLKNGVEVTGADIGTIGGKDNVTRAANESKLYNNAVEITLAAPPNAGSDGNATTTTTYYKVTEGTVDAATGRTQVIVAAADKNGTTTVPTDTNDNNYFKVVVTSDGSYTVTYLKASGDGKGIDLGAASTTGKTTVVATNVPATGSIALSTKHTDGSSDVMDVNAYAVTEVVSGGLTSTEGIKVDGVDKSKDSDGVVTYKPSYKLDGNAAALTLEAGKKYAVTAATVRGVTTYSIAAGVDTISDTWKSYLEVTYDSTTKKTTVSFHEGTAASGKTTVTLKEFADNITTPVAIKGTGAAEDCTTLVLSEDGTGKSIEYKVTELPSTITKVENVTSKEDSVEYKATYKFAADAKTLALSKTEGTRVYVVTPAKGDGNATYGVYTCSIAEGVAVTEEKPLTSYATQNYFVAKTEANGNVTVTYHVAEDSADGKTTPVKLTLDTPATGVEDALTVTVDPTGAATGDKSSHVTFTFGEKGDPALTYKVDNLTAYQDTVEATSSDTSSKYAIVKETYVTSYDVAYKDSTGAEQSVEAAKTAIVLEATAPSEGVEYYEVERSGGTTAANGVYTFTLKGPGTTKPSGAYVQVTYKSEYVVAVTYVNPNGADYSLTKDGMPNITINADALSTTKVDTIDITETTGGDYNGVNFALTNVPVAVTNILGKEDGKDTVSYKTAAVLADDSAITLDSTKFTDTVDTVYYAVSATSTKDERGNTICDVTETGTVKKPDDTFNYFAVKKGSSGYTVSYHMAEGEGGLGLDSGSVLGVDASKLAVDASSSTDSKTGVTTVNAGSVTFADTTGIVVNVTNANGGVESASTNAVDSISYVTDNFAWTPGTYYVKVATGKASTIAAATADDKTGITVPGAEDTYAKFTVTKVTTGTGNSKTEAYQLDLGGKYLVAADTTGAMGETNTKVSTAVNATPADLTIALPARKGLPASIAIFDAGKKAYKAITGVIAGDSLSNVDGATQIVTESLTAGGEITVNTGAAGAEATEKVITAGADGALTVYGDGSVLSGAVKLEAAEEGVLAHKSSSDATPENQLIMLDTAGAANDGVVVTFTKKEEGSEAAVISSITDLEEGEQVSIYSKDKATLVATYSYTTVNGKNYIQKFVPSSGGDPAKTTYAAASTGDVLSLNYMDSTSQTVGGPLSLADTNKTYYADAGKTKDANFTLAAKDAGPAQTGNYYVAVTVGATANQIAGLTVLKGNANGLLDATTAYTGTITIPASLFGSSPVKYTGTKTDSKTADSPYKVKLTGVGNGAEITQLDADDIVETAELADGQSVTVGSGKYIVSSTSGVKQKLTFKGDAITSNSTIKLDNTLSSNKLTSSDGTTIAYTGSDGVIVSFDTEKTNGIASITGLSGNETVTLTKATAKDGTVTETVTKYSMKNTAASGQTAVYSDKVMVREVTTKVDGVTVTTYSTEVQVPTSAATDNIIAATATDAGLALNSEFTWPSNVTTKTSGYFKATDVSGTRTFAVVAQGGNTPISLAANTVIVKAEAECVNGTNANDGIKLTLTPMVSDAEGKLTETSIYGSKVTVDAASAGGKIVYTADSSKSYMVAFTGVARDSVITTSTVGDTIETASLSNIGDTITVNGETITSKATSNTIGLYIASGGQICATSGTILLDGKGVTAAYNTTAGTGDKAHKDAITYTAKTGVKAGETGNNGVEAKFVNGELKGLTDLTEGESITITEPGGKTTKYEAAMADPGKSSNIVIWKTISGSSDSTENVTKVVSVVNDGTVDLVDASTQYVDLAPTTSGTGFSMKYAAGTNKGYFLIDADGNVEVADTAKDKTIATYKDAGKTLVEAEISSTGVLTLTKKMVGIKGEAATASSTPPATPNAKKVSVNANGEKITYTRTTDVADAIALIGVGAGSEFTSLVAGDTVTTAALAVTTTTSGGTTTTTADTVKVNGTTYTAGANNTTMSFDGTTVVAGTFNVKDFTSNKFTTGSTDATSKEKTESELTYTAGTDTAELTGTFKDGANVTVKDGKINSVTDLELGEKVSYTTTTTAKDGSKSVTTVEYYAEKKISGGAYDGMIKVTKTATVNGVTTIYTKNFNSNGTQNVADSSGWTVRNKEVNTYFHFGDAATTDNAYTDTGYFAATIPAGLDTKNPGYGKYTATIKEQIKGTGGDAKTLGYDEDNDANNYYLTATASKATDGTVTLSGMKLVHLESTGTLTEVTGKEVYSVAITAPTSGKIKLSEHSFIVNIKADAATGGTFTGLNDDDTVIAGVFDENGDSTTKVPKNVTVVVNNQKYIASGDTAIEIKGNTIVSDGETVKESAIVRGSVIVKETALTAAADYTKIAYTAGTASGADDGVIVAFTKEDGITSIKDLEAGEKVTVTAKDGTVTTYERTASATSGNSIFTKTVTSADGKQKAVWTTGDIVDSTANTANITAQTYGVTDAFAWPTDAATPTVGYFKVQTNGTATVQATPATSPITVSGSEKVVRAEIAKSTDGYTITSLQVLEGPTLKDVTGVEREKTGTTETTPIAVKVELPSVAGITKITLGENAVSLPTASADTKVVDRNVALNISGVTAGQTVIGLDAKDKVTTANLAAKDVITIGDGKDAVKFKAAVPGAVLTVYGDGTAESGSFEVGSGFSVSIKDNSGTVTKVEATNGNGAMAAVSDGKVNSINLMNDGDTVVVTKTTKAGVVTTDTYTAKAITGATGQILVTRESVADGVTTKATATISNDGDALSGSYVTEATGNGITSAFDWTAEGGSGYFELTDEKGKLLSATKTLEVASQEKKPVTIGAADKGKIYAKVELSADNTISGISLVQIQEDGTPKAYTDNLSDSQKFNVAITAPTGKMLTATPFTRNTNINNISITGVALESNVTLAAGDTMETVALAASTATKAEDIAKETITVNDTAFRAGASTILKFTANADGKAVVRDGVFKAAATTPTATNYYVAGVDNAAGTTGNDTDNAKVTAGNHDAIITVKNGVVTGISGQTANNDTVTVVSNGVTTTYTLDAPDANSDGVVDYSRYNVAVTGGNTATLVGLSDGSTFTISGGTAVTSGANNNTIVVVGGKYQSGVLKLTAAGDVSATGATTDAADDVTVTYTKASTASVTPVVTFKDGTVAAISGLGVDDSITIVTGTTQATATTVTYKMTTATQVTKEEWTGARTADDSNVTKTYAYISGSSDLVSANYFGSTAASGDDTAVTLPVGQFNWATAEGAVGGRTLGYFKMTSKTTKDGTTYSTTIKEQPTEEAVVAPKKNAKGDVTTSRYLVAGVDEKGTLTINAMDINSNSVMTAKASNDSAVFTDSDKVAIQAPADKAITYDKAGAKFAVNLTKVAAGSAIRGLDAKDMVTTGSLDAGSVITVNDNAYVAGINKDVLMFVGSGSDTATTSGSNTVSADNTAALYSGTIVLGAHAFTEAFIDGGALDSTPTKSAVISGSEADSSTDNITVSVASSNVGGITDDVKVVVNRGQVTSIKGLKTVGDTVTLQNVNGSVTVGKEKVEYTGANIVYEVLSAGVIRRRIFTDDQTGAPGVYNTGDNLKSESFLTLASNGEIYTGKYQAAEGTVLSNLSFKATEKKDLTYGYYNLGTAVNGAGNPYNDAKAETLIDSNTAASMNYTVKDGKFTATPNSYYLKVTSTTTSKGANVTAELMKAGATGKLVAVKSSEAVYAGALTIDGIKGMSKTGSYDEKYAVVNFTLPKNGKMDLVATNVSYKSTFTNLGNNDQVTTAPITEATKFVKGTYNIYYYNDANGGYTETRTLKVESKDDVTITTSKAGEIATLSGLYTKGEKVTLTEATADGVVTTVYQVTEAGTVKRTLTDETGKQITEIATGIAEGKNILATGAEAVTWKASEDKKDAAKIVSDFNYTLDKTPVGYFKVTSNAATALARTKAESITDSSNYIAVTVSGADGVVSSVEQVAFDTDTKAMKATADTFGGTLTIKAPTGVALSFNRTALQTNMTDATVAITGAIAGSEIKTDHNGDTVTTGKLAKAAAVTVNDGTFTAVNGGALGFKVADVDINGKTLEDKTVLTSGTVSLTSVNGDEGLGFVYAGDNLVEYTKAGAANDGITVTSMTKGNKITFTVGGLGESESFKVNDQTFQRSGKTLICTYTDEAGDPKYKVLALNGTSVKSDQLDITKSAWKEGTETFTTNDDGSMTTNYGKVTVNLATALSRYNADKKAKVAGTVPTADVNAVSNYAYILDTYVADTTRPSTRELAAEVVNTTGGINNSAWQTKIGDVTVTAVLNAITNGIDYTYAYIANDNIGQAITVAKDWAVTGSAFDDTIKGATSGESIIDLTKGGNDTVTLGNAIDHVVVDLTAANAGKTEITGFNAKDDLTLTGNYSVQLDKTGAVSLFVDEDGDNTYDSEEKGVTLKKASGVAVKLNGTVTYFGKGDNTAGNFTYVEGAHYYGNASGKNTLTVTTDKTKATAKTLGDDVVVDLTADDSGNSIYTNIQNVNASKSTNRVVLTAAATGSTLTGGTYQSTLKGGAGADTLKGGTGQDVFWFEALAGNDTVSDYTSGKDSIYIGGTTGLTEADKNGYTVTASGKDVVISNGESSVTVKNGVNATKAVSISADGTPNSNVTNTKTGAVKTTVDYYVGQYGKANNFTNFDKDAYYIGSTGKDTLTLAAKDKGATIDLTSSKYQSIDVVNASKVSYKAKTDTGYTDTKAGGWTSEDGKTKAVGLNITAGTTAVDITGTKYADTITCGTATTINYARGNGADVINDFSLDDVLNLTGLKADDIASIDRAVKSYSSNASATSMSFTIGDSKVTVNTGAHVEGLSFSSKGAKGTLKG